MVCFRYRTLVQGIKVSIDLASQLSVLQNPRPFLGSFSTISSDQHSFAVSYFINSCGFSPEAALSASRYVNFDSTDKPDSVIAFFMNHGFSKTQASNVIKKSPNLISADLEKNLLPKFNFFYSIGFSNSDLAKALSSNPVALRRSLENYLIPTFNVLKSFLHSNDRIIRSIKRFPMIFGHNFATIMASNVSVLREYGVPEGNIVNMLTYQPRAFLVRSDTFREVVERVRKMGFDPLKMKFSLAVFAMRTLKESTWERKMEVYKKWGWSEEDIFVAFGKHPCCMLASEDKIMAMMDLFVNKMGWESALIARRPVLMTLSLGSRIVPRCAVAQALLSKGLMKKKLNVTALLLTPEKLFLEKFVSCYKEDAPRLLKLYENKRNCSMRPVQGWDRESGMKLL